MFTQTSNIPVQLDGQQELVLQLQREDLGACPLGIVGNLQVNAKQGGTAPARRAGVLLSEIRRSLAGRRRRGATRSLLGACRPAYRSILKSSQSRYCIWGAGAGWSLNPGSCPRLPTRITLFTDATFRTLQRGRCGSVPARRRTQPRRSQPRLR